MASMGLLRSLTMLVPLLWLFWLPDLMAQSTSGSSARTLDALLQDYAYRAFVQPKTGVPYDASVPSNLTGIKISALRLRSGSLRTRGVEEYKEFQLPTGIIVSPYVERLVFVYQNLGNWSSFYYPLPGYTYLSPVLGLLAYDALNLSATNLPELGIRVPGNPLLIRFTDVESAPDGSEARCVSFDLQGTTNFSNVASDNVCSTSQQGHFAIVAESAAPSPSPNGEAPRPEGKGKKKDNSKVWIIVGSVLGGLVLLALLVFLILWAQKYKQRKKMQRMEKAAEVGEALQMTSVGDTKAPAAMVTRTQPVLETEYVP